MPCPNHSPAGKHDNYLRRALPVPTPVVRAIFRRKEMTHKQSSVCEFCRMDFERFKQEGNAR